MYCQQNYSKCPEFITQKLTDVNKLQKFVKGCMRLHIYIRMNALVLRE